MQVPEVKAYSFSDWSALAPANIEFPVPWSEVSLCVHHAGYMGTRGGVLVVRLGDGAEARSLCVKPFDKRLVNEDHELLATDILRAAGLRVPAARLASQAEIDDEITPSLIAKFECTSGSWSMPDFLQNAGLYFLRADLRQKAGIPEDLATAQQEALKAKRAERRAAIDAGDARAEPVAVLEFVKGPTLLQGGSGTALGEVEFETLGVLAAFDALFNNADRLPVLFSTEGNLGNVILEPGADGSVVCCAIDSCVNPVEGAALEKHLSRLRAEAHDPDLAAAAFAFSSSVGLTLRESQLDAIRRGWRRGIEKISRMTRDGSLQAAVDASVAARGAQGELSTASTHLLTVSRAIADLLDATDGLPLPQRPLLMTASSDAHPENRLTGPSGLGTFLIEACSSLPVGAVALFAFDFDKTLTNGFAPPGACLEARVRGGAHTLDGLRATAAVPCSRRCIITARADETGRVSQGKLQQVVSQLHRCVYLLPPTDLPPTLYFLLTGGESAPQGAARTARILRAPFRRELPSNRRAGTRGGVRGRLGECAAGCAPLSGCYTRPAPRVEVAGRTEGHMGAWHVCDAPGRRPANPRRWRCVRCWLQQVPRAASCVHSRVGCCANPHLLRGRRAEQCI